jgi:hypothetical protein
VTLPLADRRDGPMRVNKALMIKGNPFRDNRLFSWFVTPVGKRVGDGQFIVDGIRAIFHRPHPQKETDRGGR